MKLKKNVALCHICLCACLFTMLISVSISLKTDSPPHVAVCSLNPVPDVIGNHIFFKL